MIKNKLLLILNDQGGGVMSWNAEKSSTLRAQMKHHEPIIVLDMTHATDVVRMSSDEIVPCLQHRMGTGGNQVPLVMEVKNAFDYSQSEKHTSIR